MTWSQVRVLPGAPDMHDAGGGTHRRQVLLAQTPRPPRMRPTIQITRAMMIRTMRMVHNMV